MGIEDKRGERMGTEDKRSEHMGTEDKRGEHMSTEDKRGMGTEDKKAVHMDTVVGSLRIEEDGAGICGIYFEERDEEDGGKEEGTELLGEAVRQLTEYFDGKRTVFELPLSLKGTDFQVEDWKALCTIPYGETRSYKEIAEQIGRPKAFRAVGLANHNNPVSIVVPCHRVIGADGKMVGYGGGLDKKVLLLEMERKNKEE